MLMGHLRLAGHAVGILWSATNFALVERARGVWGCHAILTDLRAEHNAQKPNIA